MPLIQCPDCGKDISDSAPACINCGRPMSKPTYNSEPIFKDEKTELDLSMFQTSLAPQSTPKGCFIIPWLIGTGAFIVALYLFSQLLFVLISPFFPSSQPQPSRVVAVSTNRAGTISGYDSATGSIIDPINIFKDYENRDAGISGKARDGESVTILEKSGNGVKIKTSSGVTGWVSSWFVKED